MPDMKLGGSDGEPLSAHDQPSPGQPSLRRAWQASTSFALALRAAGADTLTPATAPASRAAIPGMTSATMTVMEPTIPIPGSDDVLELAPTADGFGYTASITRRRSDGSAAWTALPPRGEQQDAWTAVRLEERQVIAYSWSAFDVHLDLDTGKETYRQFTK